MLGISLFKSSFSQSDVVLGCSLIRCRRGYLGVFYEAAAIAYFNVVLVEKGVIFVLSRKLFRYELEEGFADVSFHVAAERRVIPDNVTLAVSSWSRCLLMFVIGEACCVSAGFEGVVLGSLSFVKFVFVAGNGS